MTKPVGPMPEPLVDILTRRGTSFAAPKVAAVIAQEMYLNGGDGADAWKRLTSNKQLRCGGLGAVFNV